MLQAIRLHRLSRRSLVNLLLVLDQAVVLGKRHGHYPRCSRCLILRRYHQQQPLRLLLHHHHHHHPMYSQCMMVHHLVKENY
ncbi:hypothetical protein BDF22DRAFT_664181 [Syncephalis plumigaleata]|nr:hypothetical protein BDF22DRAFT_664181 [Syncephalis plumigaleata]